EKYVNRTVSQVYNIQSLVLDPERMVVAMAEGAPPLHLRDYVEFDLGELFSGGDGRTGRRFSGFRFQNPDLGRAKEHYTLSFIAAFDGRHGEALRDLEEAGNFGFCCEVGQVAGVMRLKSHDFPGARQLLERAVQ